VSHEHAPHDEAIEHAARAGDPLSRWVAGFTAILAAIARFLHYEEGVLQTQALLFKNEAVLLQSKTSDEWNLYQAESSKGHMMEIAAGLSGPEKQGYYRDQISKYENRKKDISAKAHEMEQQVAEANLQSGRKEHPQHMFGQALALINVAISLAAVTSLTGSRKLFVVAACSGSVGIGVSIAAFLKI
jgi:hypothetical protein